MASTLSPFQKSRKLTSHTEQSHVKILKYILGVNRKTTNIAVMSELGRYPIYFSVILAMLKYCHRLEM
jgi:hypothetical protein